MLLAKGPGRAEVAIANKGLRRAQGRQGRGVVAGQHQVPPVRRNQALLGLRMAAPQHKYGGLPLLGHLADDGIGEHLPALAGVAGGLALFHGQAGVEQQHAVLRPAHQTAAGLGKGRQGLAQITLQLFENIAQRGRQTHPWRYRKRQPLGLAAPVVGVLPQDDHAHGGRIGQRQRPQGLRGKDDRARRLALLQKCLQRLPRSTGKKLGHQGLPPRGDGPLRGVGVQELIGSARG